MRSTTSSAARYRVLCGAHPDALPHNTFRSAAARGRQMIGGLLAAVSVSTALTWVAFRAAVRVLLLLLPVTCAATRHENNRWLLGAWRQIS